MSFMAVRSGTCNAKISILRIRSAELSECRTFFYFDYEAVRLGSITAAVRRRRKPFCDCAKPHDPRDDGQFRLTPYHPLQGRNCGFRSKPITVPL